MNAEALAKKLNGSDYREGVDAELFAMAGKSRLVVVLGYSDDVLEFRGAIHDEIGAFDGCECYITEDDEITINEDEGIEGSLIEAIWCPKDLDTSWLMKTEIPSFPFDVMEDGDLYCRGLVFSIDDLNSEDESQS